MQTRLVIPIDFIREFLEKRTDSPYVETLEPESGCNKKNTTSTHLASCVILFDVPEYLNIQPKKAWCAIPINTFKGSLLHLKNYKNFEDYLKASFSSKKRAQFKMAERRLYQAFPITYKRMFGPAPIETYHNLFDAFYTMLEARFLEKDMKNDELPHWEHYKQVMIPLIEKKQAFFSVFYHGCTPISMSLNVIKDQVIYGYMKCYDIDYAKFSLGFLDLLKVTQWAFEAQFERFDFLKGHYDYKTKWVDTSYYFQKLIIYNPESIWATLLAKAMAFKIHSFYGLIKILKSVKVDVFIKKVLQWHYLYYHKKPKQHVVLIENTHIKEEQIQGLTPISLNNPSYKFLRKAVFEFLYHQQDQIDSLRVFKKEATTQTYVIIGSKTMQTLSYV
ncbi:MAG: GNAT family N-acetyltransferase [Flavobacteriales bacterium]|nr:GNAT family N-acetyltransferase [Flavobacteriales bacterium]